MSSIGSPIDTSLLQAAQAQQSASKARDREKSNSTRARRYQDLVELRVASLETAEAVRKLPQNDSQQAESEHDSQPPPEGLRTDGDEDNPPRVDVQA